MATMLETACYHPEMQACVKYRYVYVNRDKGNSFSFFTFYSIANCYVHIVSFVGGPVVHGKVKLFVFAVHFLLCGI